MIISILRRDKEFSVFKQKTQGRNSYGHQPVKKCLTSEMVKWMNVKLWGNTFTHQARKNNLKLQKSEWWEQNKHALHVLQKEGTQHSISER